MKGTSIGRAHPNGIQHAASLALTKRKPFDILAEGLVLKKSRGDCLYFEPPRLMVDRFVEIIVNEESNQLRLPVCRGR